MESLDQVPGGKVKNEMLAHVRDLSELVTNCLTIFANAGKNKEFQGIPIQNKRRKLMGFPSWFGRKDRRLLQLPASTMTPNFVVSQDGNGTHTTIKAAVKAAPKNSTQRIIIYIKAGRYEEEYVKLGRKKQNIMLMGDGKGRTIISARRSVFDNFTTFHTATVGMCYPFFSLFNLVSISAHQPFVEMSKCRRSVSPFLSLLPKQQRPLELDSLHVTSRLRTGPALRSTRQ